MRVPLSWLAEFVEPGASPDELAHTLTMAGLAVDAIEAVGDVDPAVQVARLYAVEPHGQAAQLAVCRVDVGGGAPVTVVSGAPGLAPDQLVALALPGARLADGRSVAPIDVRGVRSEAVLCSARELGLGDDASQVVTFGASVRPGSPLRDLPGVRDLVLEIDVTPNRGDCLSILGIAREVAAMTGRRLTLPRVRVRERGGPAGVTVRIDAPDGCPRYAARVVRDVRVGPSPLAIQLRLQRAGMRAVNAVVDATNLVMLERGQPLHAFDAARIAGDTVVVRRARDGEHMVTLDGEERSLVPGDLLIADPERALAIAGVMGGRDSEVRDDTTSLVLESAFFAPESIRRTARRLGLVSQAAYRFERRVDPAAALPALDRVAALIAEVTGGTVAPGIVTAGPGVPRPATIALRPSRATSLLGVPCERREIRRRLQAIGATARTEGSTLLVVPPSHRGDLVLEEDLIEEVARVGGYDAIPTSVPHVEMRAGRDAPARTIAAAMRQALVAEGLAEVVTSPFCDAGRDAALPGLLGGALRSLRLRNPLSSELGVLRRTPLVGVLDVLATNRGRGAEFVGVFEIARGYGVDASGERQEPRSVAVALYGTWPPSGAERRGSAVSFADAKGIVENLLARFGAGEDERVWRRGDDAPHLHPGKSAVVVAGDTRLGVIGELHPRVAQVLDLPGEILLAELDFWGVGQYRPRHFGVRPLPRFPSVTRDIAMIVDDDFAAGAILDEVRALAEPLIESVRLFDCYRGTPIPAGRKSLAYTIAYRAPDRTLTDDEVNVLQDRVRTHLGRRFALDLRS